MNDRNKICAFCNVSNIYAVGSGVVIYKGIVGKNRLKK